MDINKIAPIKRKLLGSPAIKYGKSLAVKNYLRFQFILNQRTLIGIFVLKRLPSVYSAVYSYELSYNYMINGEFNLMKNTGVCPKCDSKNVKENQLGGMNAMWAGRIYRCEECGFSEIWSTKSHRRQINALIVSIILGSLAMLGIVVWMMP